MSGETVNQGVGYFEPWASTQFLPQCKSCGAPHPLAQKPLPRLSLICSCGILAEPPRDVHESRAVITGYHPSTLLARGLLGVGKALAKLAKRLERDQ
jgi:hypothetical protein